MDTGDTSLEHNWSFPSDLLSFLAAAQAVLAKASIPHCLIGAAALGAWGRPRATRDLDLLVLVDEESRARFIAQLSLSDIRVNQRWLDANPMAKERVTRFTAPSCPDYPLDIIYAADLHERETLARAQTVLLQGLSLTVVSPEDLILLKLKASRPTDFDDVIGIVKNPRLQLDLAYLWNWVDRLGLQGELQYVFQAADGGGKQESE